MTTAVETKTVRWSDGKDLCVEIGGARDGFPVVVHNGTPNSRHLYARWLRDATEKGICLISYDRPGYGQSTPDPGHTVASGAEHVRRIAEALGIDRLAVWGASGGGPYALACAVLLPDLVPAVASVASLAPYGANDLDYFKDMGASNAESIALFFTDREAARKEIRAKWELYMSVKPEDVTRDLLVQVMDSLLSPIDRAALTEDFATWFVRSLYAGLGPGDQGWWDDSVSHHLAWGFDIGSVAMPVKVWHGRQDRFVPVQHGEWLAAHLPGAESQISNDGHLSLIADSGDVHGWLLQESGVC